MHKPKQLSIESFKNKNRVLIMFSSHLGDESRSEQLRLLENQEDAFSDRDLVLLEVMEKGIATLDGEIIRLLGTTELRLRFGCKKGAFRAVLLGKDNRSAMTFDYPVAPTRLYELIDKSPTRLQEVREKGNHPYAG